MKLNQIANVYSGYAFKDFTNNEGGTPVIKISNILKTQEIDCDNCDYTFEKADNRFISKYGDVYIALSGATTGKVGIMKKDGYYINQRVGIVRLVESKYDPEFVRLFLLSKALKILSDAYGSAQPNISPKQIGAYELPSEVDSKKITLELLKIERLINESNNELKLLDELIKSRFNEMFGKDGGDIPLNELCEICRGASPRPISNFITTNPQGVNWIKIGDVEPNEIYITKTEEKITKEGAAKSREVHPGDFILSNSMSFGRPYILGINGCVHDGWLIISNYQKYYRPLFLYYLLRSESVQNQFSKNAGGTTVKNLNSDLVKTTKVSLYPLDKQDEFVKFAEQIDKLKFSGIISV